MKIAITGGNGIIGKYLSDYLTKCGHDVFTIDIFHNEKINNFKADVSNYREIERVFRSIGYIDVVFHLAAEVSRLNGELFYEKIWNINAVGTKHILELQKLGLFDRLIFFSSSEVYGDAVSNGVIYEDLTKEMACWPLNDYGISKLVNEMQINNHIKLTGLPCLIIRIFTAYGRGTLYTPYRGIMYDICWKILHKQNYKIYDKYARTFMYVTDLLPTMEFAINNFPAGETINVGNDELCTMKTLNDIFCEYYGVDDLAEHCEQDSPTTVLYKKPSIEKARKLLHHNPVVSVRDGMGHVAEWMKEQYGK